MKKALLLTVTLLFVVILSLTACGGGAPQGESKAAPLPATEAPAQAAVKGDPQAGQKLFVTTCSACHGPAGEGIQGLGKDMTKSEFITGKSDDELVSFVKVGRDPSDPLNTTGVAMPPKGGNPALNDKDLYNIIAYVRMLQKK
jgi:disulfide bond formation protein DsbB